MKISNLAQAFKAIKRIENNARTTRVYASDTSGFDWYFAVSGYSKKSDRYFDFYIYKCSNGEVVVEAAHTSKIKLSTMTKK